MKNHEAKDWRKMHDEASAMAKNIPNRSWSDPLMRIAQAAMELEELAKRCVCDPPDNIEGEEWKGNDFMKPENTDTPLKADCPSAPCSASWIPATTKPTGWERKVLVWVVWPQCEWPQWPEPVIGWWKHGPGCFAVGNVENANHLVTHWMDIPEPNDQTQAQPPTVTPERKGDNQ